MFYTIVSDLCAQRVRIVEAIHCKLIERWSRIGRAFLVDR